MRGVNRVTLVGNMGAGPETRQLEDGTRVTRVQMATTDVYRDKAGKAVSNTQWHTVIFWRSLGELAGKYLKKGSHIYVEGKLQHRRYEDRDGVMRYTTEIVADRLVMLDKREREEGRVEKGGQAEDDLPF